MKRMKRRRILMKARRVMIKIKMAACQKKLASLALPNPHSELVRKMSKLKRPVSIASLPDVLVELSVKRKKALKH